MQLHIQQECVSVCVSAIVQHTFTLSVNSLYNKCYHSIGKQATWLLVLYFNSEVEPLFRWQSQSYVYAQTHKCTVCKALSAGNHLKRWARPERDNRLQAMMMETVPRDLPSAALFSHMPTRHTLPVVNSACEALVFP